MKKFGIILWMAVFAFTGTLQAQDLEKVLKNHFEAIGQDKVLKTKGIRMEGSINQMGMEIPFKAMQVRPDKMRTEGTFQGMTFIQVYNGEKGWTINPFTGSSEAQPMGPDELKSMKQQSDMDGMLWNWKDKGYKLELMGKEDVEGTPCYNLQVITDENDIFNYYIDADSYMVLKVASAVVVQGNVSESETYMSNYMQVDGMAFPGTIETKSNGQTVMTMSFSKVEVNPEMDASLFEM